jgi:hypothetical protein
MSYNPHKEDPFYLAYINNSTASDYPNNITTGDFNNPTDTTRAIDSKISFNTKSGSCELQSDEQTFVNHLPTTMFAEMKYSNWSFRLSQDLISTQFKENNVNAGMRGQDRGEQDNSTVDISDTTKIRTQPMALLINQAYSNVTLSNYYFLSSRDTTNNSAGGGRYNYVILPKHSAIFGLLT